MIRVGITVEGPTEEEFIKRVLVEPLAERAILLETFARSSGRGEDRPSNDSR